MTVEELIDDILRREGGFVDHPDDHGKATKYGITIKTLDDWRPGPVTVEDVKALTIAEARDIYRNVYVMRPGFMNIANDSVRALAVDCAVNHGPRNAIKMLQDAARVYPDGIIGPRTTAAANSMAPAVLYRRLCAQRVRFYGALITRDHTQAVFAKGWMNRAAEFIERDVRS